MSAYINRVITHTGDATTFVEANGWKGASPCTFQLESGTWDLSASLKSRNNANPDDDSAAVYDPFTIVSAAGVPGLSSALTPGIYTVFFNGLAVASFSFASTAGAAAQMRFMSAGSTGG